MPREMAGADTEVFRVRVQYDWIDPRTGESLVKYYGPYRTLAAAKGQMTALTQYSRKPPAASIEQAVSEWKLVEVL